MWPNALLITVQSFLLGYAYTCLNSCLVSIDNASALFYFIDRNKLPFLL